MSHTSSTTGNTPAAIRPPSVLKKDWGIGVALALVCAILAGLILLQLAARWEAGVQPLSVEEVRRLMPGSADASRDASERARELAAAQPGTPDNAAPTDATGQSDGSGTPSSAQRSPSALRLAKHPTPDQLARKFPSLTAQGLRRVAALVQKPIGFAIFKIRGNATIGDGMPTTMIMAEYSKTAGDLDAARSWLREGIRTEKDKFAKYHMCSELAWLEDDPEVAVRLLEATLSEPWSRYDQQLYESLGPRNALDLCVVTGNEELAERYYLRYRESWPRWMAPPANPVDWFWGEREAWIRAYEARTATK